MTDPSSFVLGNFQNLPFQSDLFCLAFTKALNHSGEFARECCDLIAAVEDLCASRVIFPENLDATFQSGQATGDAEMEDDPDEKTEDCHGQGHRAKLFSGILLCCGNCCGS